MGDGCVGLSMEPKELSGGSGNLSSNNTERERQMKRRRTEILEKNRAIDAAIKAASAEKDHLASFPTFRHYDRNGLSAYLESGHGDKLSSSLKRYIRCLLKINMEGPYGSEWPVEEKVKHREMVAPEARYIFVYEASIACRSHMCTLEREKDSKSSLEHKWPAVGFVHYRFIVEEEIPVLYVYELQLENHVRGKGLGKFLMQLIELIACKTGMEAVVLTVQKANESAMNFYMNKLRYKISSMSPSRVDSLIGIKKSYEILCKVFDHEAKSILEAGNHSMPCNSSLGGTLCKEDEKRSP
ncbi:uncharacterized protein LOC131164136 isoform X2 [Malania oleifera]|uniref:uncharacterized protein LOC131164136 isoform X2 n=1 Tax=Malania oleifera TaxID=397392 RepID=UPI0025ADDCE0|nr:uncharacterized protein LOC131164136 isoform X2 [Malania oleifera]